MRWLLWALFGNDEDGLIGDARWNPERKDTLWVRVQWWFRNPFHNLTHHVWGIYGKPFTSRKVYVRGSLTKSVRELDGKSYPYWNFNNGAWEWYIGWRSSGAVGVALRRRGGSRPRI